MGTGEQNLSSVALNAVYFVILEGCVIKKSALAHRRGGASVRARSPRNYWSGGGMLADPHTGYVLAGALEQRAGL